MADSLIAELEAALALPDAEQPKTFDLGERFWLLKPYYSEEYAQEALERFESHVEKWQHSALGNTCWQAYRMYHNIERDGAGAAAPVVSIDPAGESGELLSMSINHFRGLVKHQLALVTSDRPTWDPQARTTDSEAARQVTLTRQLLDYVMSSKRLDQKVYTQLEIASVAGAAFLALGWNPNAGLKGEGDIQTWVLAPWEVCHEQVRTYEDCSWWAFRAFESRWEWAAHFAEADPEKAERIAGLDLKGCSFSSYFLDESRDQEEEADRIAVIYIYAKPNKACPQGRLSIVTGDNIVLLDGPMPYGRDVPITRIAAAEFLGTAIPYADSWSLISSQEAYNAVISAIMTRVDHHGVPNVTAPEGTEVEASDFAGANLLKYPTGFEAPKLLDLLQIPSELRIVAEFMLSGMEQLSGINSVTRGNPTENITSGSMAALLQSMAIQFNSPMERANIFNLEAVGTHVVRIFQQMATTEQIISIAGSDNRWTTETFKGEDIKQVLRVAVRSASALSKTTAGRKDIADMLLQNKAIQDPREYIKVIQTGEIESLFSGPVEELNNVKSENEMMLRGEAPGVLLWDNHELHIREHKELLDTRARYDEPVLKAINTHLQEHLSEWSRLSREMPDALAATGVRPLPQAQAIGQQVSAMESGGMAPPGAPGPSPQETPNAEPPPKGTPGPAPSPSGKEQGAEPRMPKPAKDPMTGESPVPQE